jgi:hypothetical protein
LHFPGRFSKEPYGLADRAGLRIVAIVTFAALPSPDSSPYDGRTSLSVAVVIDPERLTMARFLPHVSLLILASLVSALPTASAQTTTVGVARIDVTPDYPVRLHGYASRSEESKGVETRLYAKALAIGSGPEACVLISIDNLAVPRPVAEKVAAHLRDVADLPRERLVIAASHTHSAPMLAGAAANIFAAPIPPEHQAHIQRYTTELIEKMNKVATAALADRKPADIAWGRGSVGFAVNRRVERDGKFVFGENPAGPVDHALPVLRVAAPDGSIRAVLVNYACHCTTLDPADNTISADWAGHAQADIEADHPGAIALTVIGCGGDANPLARTSREAAARHGRALADEVKRLLASSSAMKQLGLAPRARFLRVRLPLSAPPDRPTLEQQAKGADQKAALARSLLARLDRGDAIDESVPVPVQTWSFADDLLMVFLGGEVVVDYVNRLKAELDPARLWVTAYANDVPCYIASDRILREGGYEAVDSMVFYAKPAPFRPGVEDILVNAVHSIVPAGFKDKKVGQR